MKVKIKKGNAKGTVFAPPSKSMAHRLLICAGLANGKSIIKRKFSAGCDPYPADPSVQRVGNGDCSAVFPETNEKAIRM